MSNWNNHVSRTTWKVAAAASLLALLIAGRLSGQGMNTSVNDAPTASTPAAARAYSSAAKLQNAGDFPAAEAAWQSFLQDYPSDSLRTAALHHRGVCLIQMNEFEQAARSLSLVLAAKEPIDELEESYVNLGWCHYVVGSQGKPERLEQAAKVFDRYLKKFPGGRLLDQALFYEAESLQQLGRAAESLPLYESLIVDHPQSSLRSTALFALGNAQLETRQFAAAKSTFDQFLEEFENDGSAPDVVMRKAQACLQSSEYEEAEQLFGRAAEYEGFYAVDQAMFQQAYCLAKRKHFARAAKTYAKLAREHSQSTLAPQAQLEAGRCYFQAQDHASALASLEPLLDAEGNVRLEAAHWICRALMAQARFDLAQKAAETALSMAKEKELDDDFLAALMLDRAESIHRSAKDYTTAIDGYLSILERHPTSPSAPLALGYAAQAAQAAGHKQEATELAQMFLDRFPQHPLAEKVKALLASCVAESDDQASAETSLRALMVTSDDGETKAEIQLKLGQSLFAQGKYDEVIQTLRDMVPHLPSAADRAHLYYLLGASQIELGQPQQAIDAFAASLLEQPRGAQAPQVCHRLAQALVATDRIEDARTALDRMLQAFPEHELCGAALLQLGELAKDDADTAAAHFQKLLHEHPQSPWAAAAHLRLAEAALRAEDHAEVEAQVAAALQLRPAADIEIQCLRARVASRQTNAAWEKCLSDLEQLLEITSDSQLRSETQYAMAACLEKLERSDQTRLILEQLLDENPRCPQAASALYQLGWAAQQQGHAAEAIRRFAKIANDFPEHPLACDANFLIGDSSYDKQQYAAAMSFYQAAIQHRLGSNEVRSKALYKLGWCHLHADDHGQAADAFTALVKLNPQGPLAGEAQFLVAESLFQAGKYPQALKLYERVAEDASLGNLGQAKVFLHAGQCCNRSKDWDNARFWLSRLVRCQHDADTANQAHYELAIALEGKGDVRKAAENYDLAAQHDGVVGARARLALATLYVDQERYDRALREFLTLMYGYRSAGNFPEVRELQAQAGFAAAKAAGQLVVQPEQDADAARARVEKLLQYVIDTHPRSDWATRAKVAMEELTANADEATMIR